VRPVPLGADRGGCSAAVQTYLTVPASIAHSQYQE
jgi:hypothetical protein